MPSRWRPPQTQPPQLPIERQQPASLPGGDDQSLASGTSNFPDLMRLRREVHRGLVHLMP